LRGCFLATLKIVVFFSHIQDMAAFKAVVVVVAVVVEKK